MTVYLLLCHRDLDLYPFIQGVYDSMEKAVAEANRMEQDKEIDVGNWLIKSEKVQ